MTGVSPIDCTTSELRTAAETSLVDRAIALLACSMADFVVQSLARASSTKTTAPKVAMRPTLKFKMKRIAMKIGIHGTSSMLNIAGLVSKDRNSVTCRTASMDLILPRVSALVSEAYSTRDPSRRSINVPTLMKT